MDDSIAILGRLPALGLGELESLYGSEHVRPVGEHAAQINVMPCSIDFPRLGGTVKLCKMLTVLDTTDWHEVEKFLIRVAPEHSENMPAGKMHLGLSVYELPVTTAQLLGSGLRIKKAITKHAGRTVRLVPNREPYLNSAQVIHNKLVGDNGWELVFVRDGKQVIIAQTLFIQDISDYTVRDRGRPKRDARVGMLPPKLAQTIVNLAAGPLAPTRRATVLDPYCGTGVVLQEAWLMGYSVYATDVDARMVDYTTQNLAWLLTLQKNKTTSSHIRVETGDATTYTWQQPVAYVASETYLGRPFTSFPNPNVLSKTIGDCNLIIKKFLSNLHPQIETSTRLCLAVPAWQIRRGQFKHLPFIDHLRDLGYNRVSFKHVPSEKFLYYREGQIVARELLVLDRK